MLEIAVDDSASGQEPLDGDIRLERRDGSMIAEAARQALGDGWYRSEAPLIFSTGLRWTPDLRSDAGVCHVLTTARLSRTWSRRMDAAMADGYTVTVAGPLDAWLSPEILLGLDSRVSGILIADEEDGVWRMRARYRTVAELVASERLILDPNDLRVLGGATLGRAHAADSSYLKGWLYEDFLALLFSQVSYFDVLERNFKNETQEMDLVLRDRRITGGVIALVSAKNLAGPVGKNALVHLRAKMADRRGQCKLGFLCSATSIARTTRLEDLGYRREDSVVVFVDAETTQHLLDNAERLDTALEELIARASLT